MKRRLILGATLLTLTTAGLAQTAQQAIYLPTADAVRVVMDGRPWNGLTADGRKARITLNKDGSGTFESPITMSIIWEQRGQDICLNLRMAGTKCVRFIAIANGYQAYNAGKLDLTFTR
jgi:hypothetical protein